MRDMSPAAKSDGVKEERASRKRKPSTSTSSATSQTATPSKKPAPPPVVVKTDFGQLEEQQALERTAEQDSKLFRETCASMKSILAKMLEVKTGKTSKKTKATETLPELRTQFLLQFLTLKKLNRIDKLRTRHSREATVNAKARVDSFHLQLQNLLYEVLHLQKEVTKCLQFKSADEDINLIPLELFYSEAPADVSKEDETKANEHMQRLVRLEYENMQRKKQSEEFSTLEKERTGLEEQIRTKKDNLAALRPQLTAILETTKSVQKYLEMPLDEERDQLGLAKYLPHPLFIIFSETRAFSQASGDTNLCTTVEGDLEEAKLEFAQRERMCVTNEDDEEEVNKDEEEDDNQKKKKKKRDHHHQSDKVKKLMSVHPLSIVVKVNNGDNNSDSVFLTFTYLMHLEVVAVKVKLVLSPENKSGERDVLQASSLLAHLIQTPDDGLASPNPSTVYRLKKNTLDLDGSFLFQWAQQLAGLQFPVQATPEDNLPPTVSANLCQTHVELIVHSIRQRLTSRTALQRQISLLEKSKLISVELPIPEKMRNEFPVKVASKIRAWTSVDWEQYLALDVTRHLVDSGAVGQHDFFFRLQINSDQQGASLIALIAVRPDYPRSPPVFCLNLHHNGEYNIHNSEHVRAMEREVNTSFAWLVNDENRSERYDVLSLQITRLMSCLDVLLEAWQRQGGANKGPESSDVVFLHSVRGRKREPPLKYNPQMSIFTQ